MRNWGTATAVPDGKEYAGTLFLGAPDVRFKSNPETAAIRAFTDTDTIEEWRLRQTTK